MCGYKEGAQDNWLITQYIGRLAENFQLSSASVLLEIELPESETAGDKRMFTTHVYEAPSEDGAMAASTNNYRLLTRESTTGLSGNIKKAFHVNFTSNHNGFYLAIRDRTTCFTIRRFIVYYAICQVPSKDRRSCIQDNCPPGEYFSEHNAECRACPGKSESTESGLTVCPCENGYYRAEGEEDKACTSKY